MNADQLTLNEATMVLLKHYNADEETTKNLLDKLGDQYNDWLIEWARDAFKATFPGHEGDDPEYELEWA